MDQTGATFVNHPQLCRLQGVYSANKKTIQFRNLKFATIAGRWKDPVLFTQPVSDGHFDARRFGPSCPQSTGAVDIDLDLVGEARIPYESVTYSEFDCLNLIVTIPIETRRNNAKLPVMVWVHGGGLSIGSNSFPQYDLANFVATSVDQDVPVIGVSINYRVGIFGFLASEELGLTGNYGFKDQICAFKWIKANIEGFGGDPDKITAFGESAGSISVSALLLQSEPLFSRAILMSGEVTLRNIRNKSWQNAHCRNNLKFLGLDGLPSEDRRKILFEMDPTDIVERLPVFQHWSPTLDGELFSRQVNLGLFADESDPVGRPIWCKELVIGEMKHDGTVMKARFVDDPNALQRLRIATAALFTTRETAKLLQAYKLHDNMTEHTKRLNLVELITDLRFYLGVLKVFEGWKTSCNQKVYRYHFHQPNPIEGAQKGFASHEFDVAMLLQNFNEHLPSSYAPLGVEMIKTWADFAHGQGWPSSSGAKEVLMIGPNEELTFHEESEYDSRLREGRGQLMQELGWQKCFQLGEMLQGCYWNDKE